ncbi:hypothetical protein RJ639_043272, partial [Escallonia herrerae]
AQIIPANFVLAPAFLPPMSLQWLSLVGAIWLQSINGTNSDFPAYSSQLKKLLAMSQLQLNNLAFASDAGKLVGWFSGVAAVYLPLWLVLMIGSTLGLIGYGVQYLLLTNQIPTLPYSLVFLLTVLAGNSICWINTVCYIIAIQNFPLDRQIAVGLSTSYQGLSAKIYSDIVDLFFPSSPTERAKGYLLLNSVLPLVVCVVAAPLVRDVHVGRSRKLIGGFVVIFVMTLVTGSWAVISCLGSVISRLSPRIILIVMCVFLVIPVLIPLAEKICERQRQKCCIRKEKRVHNVNIEEVEEDHGETMGVENGVKRESVGEGCEVGIREEIGVKEMIKKVDFWLYFFVYFFGATLGLVYLNNLGQIAESRGHSRTSALVSLSSSLGFFGRLVPFLLDYYISRTKYVLSRPASIAMMMAPLSASFFLLLNPTSLSLHISTATIGICTGAITSISVSTTTELFGAKNFGVNHNILVMNIPLGSFLFGDLAALLYRREGSGADGKCMGTKCYQTTFIIWGSLCFSVLDD